MLNIYAVKMNRKIINILIVLVFVACKTPNPKQKTEQNIALNKKDSIVWKGKYIDILAFLPKRKKWKKKEIALYTNKNDTILHLKNDDGGNFLYPLFVKSLGQTFIVIFEIWEGSGNLSKRNIYRLDHETNKLNQVKDYPYRDIFSTVKEKFKINDSIFTMKGEFYENGFFNSDGKLPFQLGIYKKDNGYRIMYKILYANYVFEEENGIYKLGLNNLKLIDNRD